MGHEQDPVTPELLEMINAARRSGIPRWGPPTDSETNYVHAITPLNCRGDYRGVMATGMTPFVLYGDDVLAHPALNDEPVILGDSNAARLIKTRELDDQGSAFNRIADGLR